MRMAIVLHLYDNRWCIQESIGTSGRISKFIENKSAKGFEWRFLINNISSFYSNNVYNTNNML